MSSESTIATLRDRITILEEENRHLSHRNVELQQTLESVIAANKGNDQSARRAWSFVEKAKAVLEGRAIALILLLLLVAPLSFAQAAHSVTLTWNWAQGTGGAATGFIVQRATVSGGPYTAIATLTSPTTLTYADVSTTGNVLTEGQKYCYVVQATGNGGTTSAFSNEACGVIPFLLPAAPSSLSITVK